MDALMAALVAAALAQIGDRTAWLAAILADRHRRVGMVVAMAACALIVANMLAVVAGLLLAPMLTPVARDVLLGIALVLQGGGALFPASRPDRLAGWRISGVASGGAALAVVAVGGGLPLIVATLAARSSLPWAAAIGATLGSLAVVGVAATLGDAAWTRLPLARLRAAVGVLFLVAGLAIGLGAIGLI